MARFHVASVLLLFACAAGCRTTRPVSTDKSTALEQDSETSLSPDQRTQYSRYLKDTLAGLEKMRGKTGLIKDSIWVCWDQDWQQPNFRATEELTSPTNIGLDIILLTQRSLDGDGEDAATAKATLAKLMAMLATIDYHHDNGMFFRTYWPDTGKPADINLSSVDNLHLAFGLWVAAQTFRTVDATISGIAQRLFDRMDFSDFFNTKTNLIGGNMRPIGENPSAGKKGDPQGKFVRDAFDYKYFGSEARSLYAIGWALGLYKKAESSITDFDQLLLKQGIDGTVAEIATLPYATGPLRVLRTWDGGGFQALLPAVLIREDLYSPVLGELHRNYAQRLLNDSEKSGVPAARSASAFGVRGLRLFRSNDAAFDEGLPIYNGAAGHVDMVATMHADVQDPRVRAYWDLAYTPHPAFMAASFARDAASAGKFAELFKQNEALNSLASCVCRQNVDLGKNDQSKNDQLESGALTPAPRCECSSASDLPNFKPGPDGIIGEPNLCTVAPRLGGTARGAAKDEGGETHVDHLYQPGWGWMDGYYVLGPFKGRVVPVMISLDQAMIALSIYSILSSDGHHIGSTAVSKDPAVVAKLKQAYQSIDSKLSHLP